MYVQHCKLHKKKILILPGRVRSPAGIRVVLQSIRNKTGGRQFSVNFKCSRNKVMTLAGTRVVLLLVFPFDSLRILLAL